MSKSVNDRFIQGLRTALQRERATRRLYKALAERESNEARRNALLGLARTETGHAERWARRLEELGAPVPPDRDSLRDRLWRWVLVQSGTDNALQRAESNEVDDTVLYSELAECFFGDRHLGPAFPTQHGPKPPSVGQGGVGEGTARRTVGQ